MKKKKCGTALLPHFMNHTDVLHTNKNKRVIKEMSYQASKLCHYNEW